MVFLYAGLYQLFLSLILMEILSMFQCDYCLQDYVMIQALVRIHNVIKKKYPFVPVRRFFCAPVCLCVSVCMSVCLSVCLCVRACVRACA